MIEERSDREVDVIAEGESLLLAERGSRAKWERGQITTGSVPLLWSLHCMSMAVPKGGWLLMGHITIGSARQKQSSWLRL